MNNLLKVAYNAMDEKQAMDLVVIDFRNHSPFVDYFIIGSARNQRMANAIIDNVEECVSNNGYTIKHVKKTNSKWNLLDLGDVVCHVFYDEERQLYNLEGLWKDLPRVQM